MSIKTFELFIFLMTVQKSIEVELPTNRELAVGLIDYMHDKCEWVIIWIDGEYCQYSWYCETTDNEAGWIEAGAFGEYGTTPTKDLPFEGGERVKFVNVQNKS